ncbi:MlaD family protein [Gordonia sp. VNK21]|uniref:MlaD family protein n=1 Tax=Gordonia sp. VNK21 TaxID=3382483 RepID=UPI0038D3F69B
MKRLQAFAVQDETDPRTEVLWALAALVVVVVLTVVLAVVYLRPPGRVEYRARLEESGGVVTGTEVRVAGIPVGKVVDVTLRDDRVDVRMAVEDTVFIGDQTSLQVRMLTVVGGAYVALLPAGVQPLGSAAIPAARTSIPYSTSEVLNAAAQTVEDIDAMKLRRAAVRVTDSLDSAPGAVRSIADDVETLTALLDEQQGQVTALASLGAEYTSQLAAQQDMLEQMIQRIRAVLPVMIGYKDRGILTYDALGEMVLYVGDILGDPYMKRLKMPLEELVTSATATKDTAERMGSAIDSLKQLVDGLSAVAHPGGLRMDFGEQVVDDSAICIPIAGRSC